MSNLQKSYGQNQQNKNGISGILYPLIYAKFILNLCKIYKKKMQWANFEQYTKKFILSNCPAHFCSFFGGK